MTAAKRYAATIALVSACLHTAHAQIPVISSSVTDMQRWRSEQLWSLVNEVDTGPKRIYPAPADPERVARRGQLIELVEQIDREIPRPPFRPGASSIDEIWAVDLDAIRPIFKARCASAGLCGLDRSPSPGHMKELKE